MQSCKDALAQTMILIESQFGKTFRKSTGWRPAIYLTCSPSK